MLKEMGDTVEAIKFIESHEELEQVELWRDYLDYCVQDPVFLSKLMDCLGVCKLNPVLAVNAIPLKMKIPAIRQKIVNILKQFNFQVTFIYLFCVIFAY